MSIIRIHLLIRIFGIGSQHVKWFRFQLLFVITEQPAVLRNIVLDFCHILLACFSHFHLFWQILRLLRAA